MKLTPFLTAAALFALSACDTQPTPEVVDTNPDPMATALANAAPVELPPAIRAEETFRCKDNSLVFVTFFEGDRQVNLRSERNGAPTTLRAEKAGDPLVADGGYELTGDTGTITLTTPGKAAQTCRT